MRIKDFVYFAGFGLKTILFKKKDPVLGTIILTDKCNLSCKHCSVNNKTTVVYPYKQIRNEMEILYRVGVRILFFCGGETFLWSDNGKTLKDLVKEAKQIGFLIVNVVANGTYEIDLPEADLILLSLDGDKEHHNIIRGDTFDKIMENINKATSDNICFYMAVNQINKHTIPFVCNLAKETKNVRAVSFNFHTPYPDTKDLQLTREDKIECCSVIKEMIRQKMPVFNLEGALEYITGNSFPTPCYQCVVMENGKLSICGRCIEIDGLCEKCGYFFVAEYTLAFKGNIKIIMQMLRTYLKYV